MNAHKDPHDDQHGRDERREDNVVYLPANTEQTDQPDTGQPGEGVVLNGELVPDPSREVSAPRVREGFNTRRLVPEAARERMAEGAVELSRRAAPVAKTGGKAIVRHGAYVIAGAGVVAKRVRDAHTSSRYERVMRAAEAAGDWDRLGEWEQRAENAKDRRHGRAMDWLDAPMKLVKALAVGALAVGAVLLVVGIVLAVGASDGALILEPLAGMVDVVRWTWWFGAAYGALMLCALTAAVVLYLWQQGRAHATWTPRWAMADRSASDGGAESLVTADGIVTALQHLNIGPLNTAFKKGWIPTMHLPPTREGRGAFKGYRAIFDLPYGVTPDMIADKGDVLAANLSRNAVEVWPSDYGKQRGGRARHVNLYVADAGVMEKPVPTYPLMHSGTADVFTGVPVGITQRGDEVPFALVGSNVVFGGQPGQGKSNAVRVVMLGGALDPLAELRVHVFALNGDFDAFAPRLSLYEKGATAEHVELATEHLRQLYAEVERREGRLAELGAKKLTRPIAEKHPDLRPLVVGFSECHELFGHSILGREAAELAVAVVKRGRKTGITLVFDTQSSRADAIPSQLVENVGLNGCFSVKTWRSNDGFLGDGSFAAGIRATELRFNVDRGTMVVTGATDELFEIVRTYFVEVDDDTGWDAAAEVIARAMDNLQPGTPVDGDGPTFEQPEERGLLDDLDAVLDNDPVPAGDVAARLRDHAPDWGPYQGLSRSQLVAQLADLGVKVASTGNRWPIDPLTVRNEIARRATADLDNDEEDTW